MKQYIIQSTSKSVFSIRFILSLVGSLMFYLWILQILQIKLNKFWFLTFLIVIVFITFRILKKPSMTSCKIVLKEVDLTIKRKCYFTKKYKIYDIQFNEIERYLYQQDQYLNNFILYLNKGKKIKITMYNDVKDTNDEFENFYLLFEDHIKNYNLENTEREIMIKPTLYQSRFGLFVSYFLILIMISIPILIVTFDKKINIGSMIFLYSSSFYFIYRVYHDRKKD